MAKTGGIIVLLAGVGLLLWKNSNPGPVPLPPTVTDDNNDGLPDYVLPVEPITEPIDVADDTSDIVLQPYNYNPPVPYVDFVPLGTEWDITTIPAYQDMMATLAAEKAQVGEEAYSQMYFRSGWNLLANLWQGKVVQSIYNVAVFSAGHTPRSLYLSQSDAVSALGWLLHGEVNPATAPPSLEGFYWSNPTSNPNYRQVRDFLTGWIYATPELKAAIGPIDLDIVFEMQMTLQMVLVWRNAWWSQAATAGNFNFPR